MCEERNWETQQKTDLSGSRISRITFMKMTIPPKAACRSAAIPIKISVIFFTEIKKHYKIFIWKHNRPPKSPAILRRNNGEEMNGFQAILQSNSNKHSMGLAHKTDMEHGTKNIQAWVHMITVIWYLTKIPKPNSGGNMASPVNSDETTWCSHVQQES